jgi:hypothetical protein
VAEQLRTTYHAPSVLLTDSGTSALTLALRAALVERPGRPVALPAYCCYDIVTAANGANAPVVLYDVDPATLGPDLDSLRAALRHQPAAIVVAHLYGIPVDLAPVEALAAESGALLIEDAAQGAGASYHARPLGSFGSLSVLSFGRGKGITAGRGGALLAHDERGQRLFEAVRSQLLPARRGVSELVMLKAQWLLGRPSLYGIPASIPWLGLGETVYREPRPPRAMSRVAAAVLEATWPLAAREAEVRRANAARLLRGGQRVGYVFMRVPADAQPGYLRLPLLQMAAQLRPGDGSVGMGPAYPRSLPALDRFLGGCVNRADSFRGAETLVARLSTIPVHSRMGADDLGRVERWLTETNLVP